jgi:hypothetical protein
MDVPLYFLTDHKMLVKLTPFVCLHFTTLLTDCVFLEYLFLIFLFENSVKLVFFFKIKIGRLHSVFLYSNIFLFKEFLMLL